MKVYGEHSKQLQSNAKSLFALKALKRALEDKGHPEWSHSSKKYLAMAWVQLDHALTRIIK